MRINLEIVGKKKKRKKKRKTEKKWNKRERKIKIEKLLNEGFISEAKNET